jgi:hypothetical protein
MIELFAPQQIGRFPEDKWREWASSFVGHSTLANSGIPDPRGFSSWDEWAKRLTGIMTIKSKV